MARPWCLAGALAFVTTTAAAAPPEGPYTGPTGAGRLLPADPLEEPAWREDARKLRVATDVLGGLTAASWIGYAVARTFTLYRAPFDDPAKPGYEEARTAMFATAFLHGAIAVSLVAVAIYRERHLERAVLAPLPGLRADPSWQARDRRLTHGLRASAGIAGVAGAGFTIVYGFGGDGPGAIWPDVGLGILGGSALVALAAFGAQRRKHRARLERWPRIASGGLSWQF